MLRPRTRAALEAMRERGADVIVVTGRMFQAVRRYLTGPEPVVCYQGALVADPASGEFLLHVPIPVDLAARGHRRSPGLGTRPELLRRRRALRRGGDAGGRALRDRSSTSSCASSGRCSTGSSDRRRSSSSSATRSGSTRSARRCARSSTGGCSSRSRCRSSSSSRTRTCRRAPGCSSSPTASASRREQTIAFGDGENDLELIDWAGYSRGGRKRAPGREGARRSHLPVRRRRRCGAGA